MSFTVFLSAGNAQSCFSVFDTAQESISKNANYYSEKWVEDQLLKNGVLEQIKKSDPKNDHIEFFAGQAQEILKQLEHALSEPTSKDNHTIRLDRGLIRENLTVDEGPNYVAISFGNLRQSLGEVIVNDLKNAIAQKKITYNYFQKIAYLSTIIFSRNFEETGSFRNNFIEVLREIREGSQGRSVIHILSKNPEYSIKNFQDTNLYKIERDFEDGFIYIPNLAIQSRKAFLNVFENKILFVRVATENELVDGFIRSPLANLLHDYSHAFSIISAIRDIEKSKNELFVDWRELHKDIRKGIYMLSSRYPYMESIYFDMYHENPHAIKYLVEAFQYNANTKEGRKNFFRQIFLPVGFLSLLDSTGVSEIEDNTNLSWIKKTQQKIKFYESKRAFKQLLLRLNQRRHPKPATPQITIPSYSQ